MFYKCKQWDIEREKTRLHHRLLREICGTVYNVVPLGLTSSHVDNHVGLTIDFSRICFRPYASSQTAHTVLRKQHTRTTPKQGKLEILEHVGTSFSQQNPGLAWKRLKYPDDFLSHGLWLANILVWNKVIVNKVSGNYEAASLSASRPCMRLGWWLGSTGHARRALDVSHVSNTASWSQGESRRREIWEKVRETSKHGSRWRDNPTPSAS